jgi:cytochrome bd ubiquinol oxidase subunit I
MKRHSPGELDERMNNFLAARSQVGMSLEFHIIFAVIGMALPMMMSIAEWRSRYR